MRLYIRLWKKKHFYNIGGYHKVSTISVIYKLLSQVVLNSIERTLDERRSCEEAKLRKRFSTLFQYIQTITRLTEDSQKTPCPTDPKVNMMKDLASELKRRKRAACWVAFNNIEDVMKRTKSIRLCAQLFD